MKDTPPASSETPPGLETQRLQSALERKLFDRDVPVEAGRFVIEGRIGEGGMGTVFRARDPDLDRTVALKVLRRTDFVGGKMEEEQQRLRREALALAKLSHPNVVGVHEVGVHGDELFIAMEYVEGGTLGSWCDEHSQATAARVSQVLAFALDAARGLAAAHAAGLLHRDLKPANLLIGDDGRLRIADFGLVRYRSEAADGQPKDTESDREARKHGLDETALTQTGQVVGTPAYMAPEQFDGISDVRSDQFSWAVSFYEALYGTRPYLGTTPTQVVASIHGGRMAEPEAREVPAAVRRLLHRALDPDPRNRFEAMRDIVAELERIRRPRRWLMVTSAFGLGGALVWGAVWLNEAPPEPLPALCQDARPLLDEAWGSARRDAVGRQIADSGVAFAQQTGTMVEQRLDAYARSWVEAYQSTCVESHRAEQSELSQSKLACLQQAASELGLVTSTLADADAQTVGSSADLLLLLPEVAECQSADRLRFASSSVSYADPAVRQVVDAITQAEVYERIGRRDDAIETASAADQQARELEVPALSARAGRLLSAYSYGAGDYPKAARYAEQALSMAERAGDPSALAMVWLRVFFAQSGQAEPKLADAALQRAASWASHPDCRPAAASSVRQAQAGQKSLDGKHRERLTLIEEALALAQQAFDPSHPRVAQIIGDQAEALAANGDTAEAEAAFERAIELMEAFYGDAHVNLVPILQARAGAQALMREDQRSLEAAQRGLDILADNPWYRPLIRVQLLLQVAEVFRKRRELEEAVDYAQQAERVALEQLGRDSKAALHAKFTFANISYSFQNFEDAAEAYQQLLANPGLSQLGQATVTVIRSNGSLALSFVARHDEAIAMAERALVDAAENFGTPSDRMVNFTLSMGQVYGAAERHEDAVAQFRAGLHMLDELERDDDPRRGKTYWGLAEQLDALGKRTESVQWGQRAHAAMVAGGFDSGAADLRKWLAERGSEPTP